MIVITNRKLCEYDFLKRIEQIAKARPEMIILREKDMLEKDYEDLAKKCFEICLTYKVDFAVNSNIEVANRLLIPSVHLPYSMFLESFDRLSSFRKVGVSIHSVSEAKSVEEKGASYLIAGHIFQTDCKKDVPPRGVEFLKQVCSSTKLPVYAIGGVSEERVESVKQAGASGFCIMSQLMQCKDAYLKTREYLYK